MVSNAYGKSWSSFLRSVVIATLRNHKSLRLIFLSVEGHRIGGETAERVLTVLRELLPGGPTKGQQTWGSAPPKHLLTTCIRAHAGKARGKRLRGRNEIKEEEAW